MLEEVLLFLFVLLFTAQSTPNTEAITAFQRRQVDLHRADIILERQEARKRQSQKRADFEDESVDALAGNDGEELELDDRFDGVSDGFSELLSLTELDIR